MPRTKQTAWRDFARAARPVQLALIADLTDSINGLDEQLATVGDDAELANVDLQNWLQKEQQTLQTMSNISKLLNDTAMAIIRKIGG